MFFIWKCFFFSCWKFVFLIRRIILIFNNLGIKNEIFGRQRIDGILIIIYGIDSMCDMGLFNDF